MKRILTLVTFLLVLLLVSCTKTPDYLGNISGGETTPGNTETIEPTDPGKNLVIYEPEIKDDGNWHKFPEGYKLIIIPVEIFYDIVMGYAELETYADSVMLDSTTISYYKITSSQVILVYTEQSAGTIHLQFSISANNFIWGVVVDDGPTEESTDTAEE